MALPFSLNDIIASVTGADPDGDALHHLSQSMIVSEELTGMADGVVGHFVEQARQDGASWAEIGGSMGVTRQAAQKRFVPREPADATSTAATIFARLNDAAKQATESAKEHARQAQHDQVKTEHVVLGLLDELEGLAAHAVEALDVPLEQVAEAVKAAFNPPGRGVQEEQTVPDEPVGKDVPFGRDARKLFDQAMREARRRGRTRVGPEHLLLGLLRDDNSPGAAILNSFGITREQAERWFHGDSEEEWS